MIRCGTKILFFREPSVSLVADFSVYFSVKCARTHSLTRVSRLAESEVARRGTAGDENAPKMPRPSGIDRAQGSLVGDSDYSSRLESVDTVNLRSEPASANDSPYNNNRAPCCRSRAIRTINPIITVSVAKRAV